jgi:hypothetical protein
MISGSVRQNAAVHPVTEIASSRYALAMTRLSFSDTIHVIASEAKQSRVTPQASGSFRQNNFSGLFRQNAAS